MKFKYLAITSILFILACGLGTHRLPQTVTTEPTPDTNYLRGGQQWAPDSNQADSWSEGRRYNPCLIRLF
jgi:hypothetical protein